MEEQTKKKPLKVKDEVAKARAVLKAEAERNGKEAGEKLTNFMKTELPDYILDIDFRIILRPKRK